MATKIENLTPQIDGIKDTFSTELVFDPATVTIGYNGQMFPPGVNVDSFPTSQSIKLTFVPEYDSNADLNSKLMVIYEELADSDADIVGSAMPPGAP